MSSKPVDTQALLSEIEWKEEQIVRSRQDNNILENNIDI